MRPWWDFACQVMTPGEGNPFGHASFKGQPPGQAQFVGVPSEKAQPDQSQAWLPKGSFAEAELEACVS